MKTFATNERYICNMNCVQYIPALLYDLIVTYILLFTGSPKVVFDRETVSVRCSSVSEIISFPPLVVPALQTNLSKPDWGSSKPYHLADIKVLTNR